MSAYALDPLRDSRHRDARSARECADWLAWLELEGKAPRTLDDYERTVAVLLRSFPRHTIDTFTDGDVVHVLRSFPAGSRRVKRAHLSSFFRWAKLTRRINDNPIDLIPRVRATPQRIIDVFTDTEISLLTSLPSPDGPLLALMFDTGIRKGEARRLLRRHVNIDRGELNIYRGKGDKDRIVPLTKRAAQAVADLDLLERLGRDDHLWYSRPGGGSVIQRSRPIGEGTFARWYDRCTTAAGVAYRHPHTTRHTFATRCLRVGIPLERVSLLMGHTSVRTTFDLYGHLDLEDVRRDLLLLEA